MDINGLVRDVILGRQANEDEPEDAAPRFFTGKIIEVDDTGVKFIVPNWDGGKFEFGPMPYPRWTSPSATLVGPQVGNDCLVVFLGNNSDVDSQEPWILGWR